ncbi:MAG TPA: metallophosphoesterase [Thermoanaerobaculaceae bacterium]|nr:metallophosphoesterase [Thermoanaerobaculaceae bacterium]HRS14967.1 metallophosphoesterase [Thermoanaerobaculaceae bacterium]
MLAWAVLRAILADLHLGQRPGDGEAFARTLGELRRRGAGELVLLGDVFKTLVGFPRFWDESVRAGLSELAAARAAGLRVVIVEGNRDFFIDAAELAPFCDRAGRCHSFSAGGRRVLCEHGDTLNRSDRLYLFWRSVSKSGPARLWARLLPRRLALCIIHRTEARLSQTNFSYRKAIPETMLEQAARRHFVAGIDVVLWGHFHRRWRFAEGGREALVLPAWIESRAVTWVGADGALQIEPEDVGQFVDTASRSWYEGRESNTAAR